MTTRKPTARPKLESLEAREVLSTSYNGETLRLTHPEDYQVHMDLTAQPQKVAPVVRNLAVGYRDPNIPTSWRVRLYQDPTHYQDFPAFNSPRNNPDVIRVATGDVTGDGVPDVVAAMGHGGDGVVKVYDGTQLGVVIPVPLRTITPEPTLAGGGRYVAVGDFDGDEHAEVVVSIEDQPLQASGGQSVRVYSGADFTSPFLPAVLPMLSLDPFGDPNFTGGAHCAVGDVNHDGVPDLITGAGRGGGPRVSVWDGTTLRRGGTPAHLCNDFFALDPNGRTGIHVAVADVNRDERGDILASPQSGQPQMTAFDGANLIAGTLTLRWDRLYGDTTSTGGLRMVARDLDGDGVFDLALSHADKSRVTTIRGQALTADGNVYAAGLFNGPALGVWVG